MRISGVETRFYRIPPAVRIEDSNQCMAPPARPNHGIQQVALEPASPPYARRGDAPSLRGALRRRAARQEILDLLLILRDDLGGRSHQERPVTLRG